MSAIQVSEITDDVRAKMSSIVAIIAKLREFENKCNFELFKYLFGQQADHLFVEVFVRKSNRCIFAFLRLTDKNVQDKLLVNVFLHKTLYANCR